MRCYAALLSCMRQAFLAAESHLRRSNIRSNHVGFASDFLITHKDKAAALLELVRVVRSSQ
jgi:hypothetical protein